MQSEAFTVQPALDLNRIDELTLDECGERLPELLQGFHIHATDAIRGIARCYDAAIVIGKVLLRAKAQARHGEWLAWLDTHAPSLNLRTAQSWMKRAADSQTFAHLDSHKAYVQAFLDSGLLPEPETPEKSASEPAPFSIKISLPKEPATIEPNQRVLFFEKGRGYLELLQQWGLIEIKASPRSVA